MNSRWYRIVAGVLLWACALGGLGWCLNRPPAAGSLHVTADLWQYASGRRLLVDLAFSGDCEPVEADPVFLIVDGQSVRRVGEVRHVVCTATGATAQAVFYAPVPPLDAAARLTYHATPDSLPWVLKTMLSDAKQQQIVAELQDALEQHQTEILKLLQPVAEQALRDMVRVVEQDLPAAIQKRRARLEELGDRFERDTWEREFLPLVRAEVWPIVRRHAEPVVTEVGRELWQRASLWRFGWRYVYDRTPLPQKNLTKREWQRFLEEDATPVLQAHADDFLRVQQQIAADVAQNPRIRETVRVTLAQFTQDPELRALVWGIAREVLVDNPRLREVIQQRWRSPQTQYAMQRSAERFEPTVRRIGDLLLGTPEKGVTPEFARVLRNQILHKDRRWLVLTPSSGTAARNASGRLRLLVTYDPRPSINPFVLSTVGEGNKGMETRE